MLTTGNRGTAAVIAMAVTASLVWKLIYRPLGTGFGFCLSMLLLCYALGCPVVYVDRDDASFVLPVLQDVDMGLYVCSWMW